MGADQSKSKKDDSFGPPPTSSRPQSVVADEPLLQPKASRRASKKSLKDDAAFPSAPKSEPTYSEQQLKDLIRHLELHMDNLEGHMRILENTKVTYKTEFSSIRDPPGATAKASEEHPNLNRYKNIVAYDHSRVKVKPNNHNLRTDYINANYMPGYNSKTEYIASQGPVPDSFPAFWQMVWENNVDVIVMVTNEIEGGKLKAHRYWPASLGEQDQFGDIRVTLTFERTHLAYIKRGFTLYHNKTDEKREIYHFCYTAWPDHGVPETTEEILLFREVVRLTGYDGGKLLTHCSAGVGRTGTYLSIDRLINQAFDITNKAELNVLETVTELRSCRNYMVQTLDQYNFVYEAVLDGLSLGAYRLKKALNRLRMNQAEIREEQVQQIQTQINYAKAEPAPKPVTRSPSKQTGSTPYRAHSTSATADLPTFSFNPYLRQTFSGQKSDQPELKRANSKISVEERKQADPVLGEAASYVTRRQSLQAAIIDDLTRINDRDLAGMGYYVDAPGVDARVQSFQQLFDESFSAAYSKAAASWSSNEEYNTEVTSPLMTRVQSLQEQWELRGSNFRKQIEDEQFNDLASLENRLKSLLENVEKGANPPKHVDLETEKTAITLSASDRLQSAVEKAANWSKDDNFGRAVDTPAAPVYLGQRKPSIAPPAPVTLNIKKKESIVPLFGKRPSVDQSVAAPAVPVVPEPIPEPVPEPPRGEVEETVDVNKFAPLKPAKKAEAEHPMIANARKLSKAAV